MTLPRWRPSLVPKLFFFGFVSATAWAQASPAASGAMSLADAYRLAEERNELVHIAQKQVSDAHAAWLEAWSQGGPQATVVGQGTLQNAETITLPDATLLYQADKQVQGTALVTQPLFRRGFFSGTSAASLGEESATATLSRSRQQLMIDVATSFIGVMRARQQVLLAQSAVKRGEAQHANAAARYKAGGALRTAELLASIEWRRAQVQLVDAERTTQLQAATFERLVGVIPPSELSLPPTPSSPALDAALAQAASRVDLRALNLKTEQAREIESAIAGHRLWPTLDVQGAFYYYAPPGLGGPYAWGVSALVSFPIFQGGIEYVRMERQRIQTEIAEQQETLKRKQIVEEVRQAATRLENAQKAVALSELQVKDALDNYNLIGSQFKLGGTTFLEVANSQAALTEAENLRSVAFFDRELAAYQLLFATGELAL